MIKNSLFYLLVCIYLFFGINANTQSVSISTEDSFEGHASSILHLDAEDKGLLITKVALTAANISAPIIDPEEGLLIYNTATEGAGENEVYPGFYWWNGSRWIRIGEGGGGELTCLYENYVVKFDGDNASCSQIYDNGTNVGIGTDNPQSRLVVVGTGNTDESSSLNITRNNNNSILFVRNDGRVGIATTLPSRQLEITESFRMPNTTCDNSGIIYLDDHPFIHNFHPPPTIDATPTGCNTFIGINAGSFTLGSSAGANFHASHNTAIGTEVLHNNTDGFRNTGIGHRTLFSNTIGRDNTAIGYKNLRNNTTGERNTAVGFEALYSNIENSGNTAIGYQALNNSTSDSTTAVGYQALYSLTTGDYNTAIGSNALYNTTTGSYNIAVGVEAGSNNTTGSESIFIGYNAQPEENNQTNQIIIGHEAIGRGSNTAVLGNDDIERTFLRGHVGINLDESDGNPSQRLDVKGNARFRNIGTAVSTNQLYATGGGVLSTSASDKRLKDNIVPLQINLEKFLKMQGVSYTWKNNPESSTKIGFIAQELNEIYPEFVFTNNNTGYFGINYAEITAIFPEILKEQQKIIKNQQNDIQELKNLINKQQNHINKLIQFNAEFAD